MFSEIKDSTGKVLIERVSSPFYGAFIFSWFIWNWEIPYTTFFVSQERFGLKTKVEYITEHYNNYWYLIVLPFVSAIILVALFPYIGNLIYKMHLRHEKVRVQWKQQQEKEKLLSIEESAQIRNEIADQDSKHRALINYKDNEIKQKQIQIDELNQEKNKFKILYACYGKDGKYNDVSSFVSNLISYDVFTVNNETMGDDPIHGIYKELLIIYSQENIIHSLRADEHEQILRSKTTGLLEKVETTLAKEVQLQEAAKKQSTTIPEINDIFPGTWLIEILSPKKGEETFKIEENTKYFYREKGTEEFTHFFNIENAALDLSEKNISFDKKEISSTKKVEAVLRIITFGKEYEGTEINNGVTYKVRYSQIANL